MERKKISGKKQLMLLVIIAGIALVLFYFKTRASCLESLRCETSYCLKTSGEAATSCATKLMVIYSVPIILGANLVSMGILSIMNKIVKKKTEQ